MHGGITILVENTVRRRYLYAEHGLSMFIEVDGHALLFDTGQTDILLHNARELGVDLTRAESVVLSHGHYDHTGGLSAVLGVLPTPPSTFAHPDVFIDRFACRNGESMSIGVSFNRKQLERTGAALELSNKPQEILPGVVTTGEVPRLNDFEDVGGTYFLDDDCRTPDLIKDDQAVVIDAPEGLIICCGCAHSGVVNTIRHARQIFQGRPVDTVIGGMHLVRTSAYRLNETIKAFREFSVRRILGGHCTGAYASRVLWTEMPDIFAPLEVGARHQFGA